MPNFTTQELCSHPFEKFIFSSSGIACDLCKKCVSIDVYSFVGVFYSLQETINLLTQRVEDLESELKKADPNYFKDF